MEEELARSHQSVDWYHYFKSIREECPWSYAAYLKGAIGIEHWCDTDKIEPLGKYQARMYIVDYPDAIVQAMAEELDCDDRECEWLFSYPGYGAYATPVKVLIQQNRKELDDIRTKLNPGSESRHS